LKRIAPKFLDGFALVGLDDKIAERAVTFGGSIG
jgi:hypothetical protein